MLKSNNNRIWIGTIAFLVLVIIGGYFYFHYKLNVQNTVEAEINGEKITQKQLVDELKKIYGKEALDQIINKKVVEAAASKYNIQIVQSDIDSEYTEFARDYDSEADFEAYLKEQMGWTKEQFIENIKYYLLWQELAIKDIDIEDNEIKEYYDNNISEFTDPERFHIQQIVLNTKEEASQVLNELQNGSDFGTLAKEKSLDTLSLASGGDLGYVSMNDTEVDPAVITKAKSMKVNDIDIAKLVNGYAVVKVLGYEDKVKYSLDQVKGRIRRELGLLKAPSLPDVLEQLKKDLNVKIIDKELND